jgi:hypothetical protein
MSVIAVVKTKELLEFVKSVSGGTDVIVPLNFNDEEKKLVSVIKKITSKVSGELKLTDLIVKNENLLETTLAIPSSKKLIKFLEELKDYDKIYMKIDEISGYYTLQITESEKAKIFIYLLLSELEEKETPIRNEKIEQLTIFRISLTDKKINELKKFLKVVDSDDVKLVLYSNNDNNEDNDDNNLLNIAIQIGDTINTEYVKITLFESLENEILKEKDSLYVNELTKQKIEEMMNEFINKTFDEDTGQEIYEIKLNKDDLLETLNSLNKDKINTFSILSNGAILFKTVSDIYQIFFGIQPLI